MRVDNAGSAPHKSPMHSPDPRLSAFLARCEQIAARLRISRATLSTRLLSDGKRLDQLYAGDSDIGILRLARAEQMLAGMEGQSPTPSALARRATEDRAPA